MDHYFFQGKLLEAKFEENYDGMQKAGLFLCSKELRVGDKIRIFRHDEFDDEATISFIGLRDNSVRAGNSESYFDDLDRSECYKIIKRIK